jgi:hypothetical protein
MTFRPRDHSNIKKPKYAQNYSDRTLLWGFPQTVD